MKKVFSFTTVILCLFTLLQTSAFARAGGGGGGISGGGRLFRRFNDFFRNFGPEQSLDNSVYVVYLVLVFLCILVFSIFAIILCVALVRARIKSKILLTRLGKNDPLWNPKTVDLHIKQSFYDIQKAWSDERIHTVKHLLSETLYQDFLHKLERNRKENTKNVLSKIKLKKAYPVSVQDRIGEDNDCIWYCIKARMLDLTYEASTMQLLSEVKKPTSFTEYWRFCKKDGTWVLDRIYQELEYKSLIVKSERPQ